MPRRNLLFLLAVCIFALVCYQKTQTNQYGQLLSESLDLIERISLEKVKPEELFEGAMEGMVERLNSGGLDENSSYIPPKTLPEFQEIIDQQFGGVGMRGGDRPQDAANNGGQPAAGLAGIRGGRAGRG